MLAQALLRRARFLARLPHEPVPLPTPSIFSAANHFDESSSLQTLESLSQQCTSKGRPSSPHVSSHFHNESHPMAAGSAWGLNEWTLHTDSSFPPTLSSGASSLAPTLACSDVVQNHLPSLPSIPLEHTVEREWSPSRPSQCPSKQQPRWSCEHDGGVTTHWGRISHWTIASNCLQYKLQSDLRQRGRERLTVSQSRQLSTKSGYKQKESVGSTSVADSPVRLSDNKAEVSETVGVEKGEGASTQDTQRVAGWETWTKDEAFNLPNGISMARLVSGPAIGG